eukprot:SAG11_NODE_1890_length_4110_cov_3.484418_2_plen_1196_part_00
MGASTSLLHGCVDQARPTLAELQAIADKDHGGDPWEKGGRPGTLNLSIQPGPGTESAGLKSLPEEIGQLASLKELNLSRNMELRSVPTGLWTLRQLEKLDLFGCGLSSLPKEVAGLVSLQSLDLSGNESLPEELRTLKRLQLGSFFGDNPRLRSLPSGLWSLVGLERLTLFIQESVELEELPGEIVHLVGLKELCVCGSEMLRSLPAGLGSLGQLETLEIAGSGRLSLPAEVAGLVSLRKLRLSGAGSRTVDEMAEFNDIDGTLRKQIGAYELRPLKGPDGGSGPAWDAMEEADQERMKIFTSERLERIQKRSLWSLPAEMWSLTRLEYLCLENVLEALPREIGQLVGLKKLSLKGNLRSLPAELARLPNLNNLDLDCPGLVTLQKLLREGGLQALTGYIKDKEQLEGGLFEPSRRHSLKLVLAGPTEAGKTSLLRALMFGERRQLADLTDERTIGLDIHRFTLPDPTSKGRAALHLVVYDAGGHGEYQELHQAFFSCGALYLLLWDVSKPLLKPIVAELCRWATSIQACAPGATVLLVGSHADQAESAAVAERSCTVVLQRLHASLAAQAAALRAKLQRLEAADGGDEAQRRRRTAQLKQLVDTPLRLSAAPVLVSAKTLQNIGALKERLVDAAHDAAAFPEFGNEQPWVYGAIAQRLTEIGVDGCRWQNDVLAEQSGTPSLSWGELLQRLQSMRQPPAGAAVEVQLRGTELAGEGKEAHRLFRFEMWLAGTAVLAPCARYSEWRARHMRLKEAAELYHTLPVFPSWASDSLRDMVHDAANVARRAEELRVYLQALLAGPALDHPEFESVMGFGRETITTKYGAMAAALQRDPALLRRALAFLRVTGEVLYYEQVPAIAETVFIRPQWLVDVMKELVRHDLPQLVAQLAETADASAQLTAGLVSEADALRLQAEAIEFSETGVATEAVLTWLWRRAAVLQADSKPELARQLVALLCQLSVVLEWRPGNNSGGEPHWLVPLRLPAKPLTTAAVGTAPAIRRSFILASAPVESLEKGFALAAQFGGEYTAGSAQDKLNSRVTDWRAAWEGKTHQAIHMLGGGAGGTTPVALVAIKGGPACDWENQQLRSVFCREHPNCTLKQIGDLDDFEAWLSRTYGPPAAATDAPAATAAASEDAAAESEVCRLYEFSADVPSPSTSSARAPLARFRRPQPHSSLRTTGRSAPTRTRTAPALSR